MVASSTRPPQRAGRKLRWLLSLAVAGALCTTVLLVYQRAGANPGCEVPPGSSSCTRVFFLGNSYTAVNDLPAAFASLAWSGGHRVDVAVQAPGGWTLLDHARAQSTADVLAASQWDVVVLQEQSEIPSVDYMRESSMYPAARDLVAMARGAGAKPMFFLTWGHRQGWPESGIPDYASMQSALNAGYLFIAGEQHAEVAPVGAAWSEVAGLESSHSGAVAARTAGGRPGARAQGVHADHIELRPGRSFPLGPVVDAWHALVMCQRASVG